MQTVAHCFWIQVMFFIICRSFLIHSLSQKNICVFFSTFVTWRMTQDTTAKSPQLNFSGLSLHSSNVPLVHNNLPFLFPPFILSPITCFVQSQFLGQNKCCCSWLGGASLLWNLMKNQRLKQQCKLT